MTQSHNDPPKPHEGQFHEPHRDYLTARGVRLDVALAARLRSVDATAAAQLLQRRSSLPCGGLAIPYPGTATPYYRVRLDEPVDGARFLAPAGVEVPVYLTQQALADPSMPLYIVEGPVKALALAGHGIAAVGLGGTGTTLTTKAGARRLNDSWGALALNSRSVTVVFDAGRRTNPNVARDEARLAWALDQAGAVVSLAELPLAPGGRDQGPDDYLARSGIVALRAVLAATRPADPAAYAAFVVALPEAERAARVADLLDDLTFLLALVERGPGAEARVRESLRTVKITAKHFEAALNRAKRTLSQAARSVNAEHASLGSTPYSVRDGRLTMTRSFGEVPMPEALANFSATIVREIVTDDGAEEQRRFEVTGALADGSALPTVLVEAAEFATGRWPLAKWGARANVTAERGGTEHLRAAIQELSRPVTVKTFGHTGVREIEGRPVFLHAGGAVGGANVLTNLEGPLGRFRLPDVPIDPREALELSLSLLEIGPHEVTVPLLSAMFRAPTCSLLPSDSSVFVLGQSGSTKSTQTALMMAHYGDFDRVHLPATWNDTGASLETTLFRAKDVPVVIDDFAPKGNEAGDEMRRKAAQVLRAVGNGSARGRMKADMTARENRPPRGYVISTGEDLPTGESILARLVTVRVDRRTTKLAVMAERERERARLPHAMAAFVEYVLTNYAELGPWLRERFRAIHARLDGTGGHLRTPEALAHLALGSELLSGFAVHLGVYDSAKARRFNDGALEALRHLSAMQGSDVAHADPVLRFVDVLTSLLAQGKVKVTARIDEAMPEMGRADSLGWFDYERVYLLPDATYAAVVEAMQRAGESMPLKAPTLWERLRERGLIEQGDAEHHTQKKSFAGRRLRVLVMKCAVLGIDPRGGGDDDPGGAVKASAGGNRGAGVPTAGHAASSSTPETPSNKHKNDKEEGERPGCPVPPGQGAPGRSSPPIVAEGSVRRDRTASLLSAAGAGATGQPDEACSLPPGVGKSRGTGSHDLVRGEDGLHALVVKVTTAKTVALDLVTSGPDPVLHPPVLLALGLPDGSHVVDLIATGGLGPLADALRSAKVIGHGLQRTVAFLSRHYGVVPVIAVDVEIQSKLFSGGRNLDSDDHSLGALALARLRVAVPNAPSPEDVASHPTSAAAALASRVATLPALADHLGRDIEAAKLREAAILEHGVLPSVVATSLCGVRIDSPRLRRVLADRQAELATHAAVLCAALGDINLDDGWAVVEALKKHGLPIEKTGKAALAPFLGEPVVQALTRYRHLLAFVRDLGPAMLANAARYPDCRVRPTINPYGAATGRFTYRAPNLQGLDGSDEVRGCVVPAEGSLLVVADYAAIDLRVLADHVQDEPMIAAFHARADLHRETAAVLGAKAATDVTDGERKRAKEVNFGIVYGMGAETLAERLFLKTGRPVAVENAQRMLDAFLAAHPAIAAWQQRTRLAQYEELRTVSGRLRRFSRDDSYAQRLNAPIQGTAADGLKRALVSLSAVLPEFGAHVVLTVHDEIVVEVPREHAAAVAALLHDHMVAGMAFYVKRVPIVVEVDVRATWAEGSKVTVGAGA